MKKLLIPLGIALLLAAPASAQEPERTQFYEFGNQVIDGTIKAPTVQWASGRQRVEFGRLLKLKKSMLPAIIESGKDLALR